MATSPAFDRAMITTARLAATGLDRRRPQADGLDRATCVGLQDSMPRAALLSLHARLDGIGPDVLDGPDLVQVWGPRFGVFVVRADDTAPFTLGRLPSDAERRSEAVALADRLESLLGAGEATANEAGRALGVHPNALRYAAPTGRVHIRWDGARRPTLSVVDPPNVEPAEARRELARRFLRVFGPANADDFATWAELPPRAAGSVMAELAEEVATVLTPIGEASVLRERLPAFVERDAAPSPGVHLLPSGDAAYLLWGAQRSLLVADPSAVERLWTSRVWPGALLSGGEVVGTWRRSGATLTVAPWATPSERLRAAVDQAARHLPLHGSGVERVRWEAPAEELRR